MTKLSYAHALGYRQALEKFALATPSPVDQMMSSVEGAKDVHPGPDQDLGMAAQAPTDPSATPPSIKSEELPPELLAALAQAHGQAQEPPMPPMPPMPPAPEEHQELPPELVEALQHALAANQA